jgi:hypothetical protein
MIIGGLWVPWQLEPCLRDEIAGVRAAHGLRREMKWIKVSRCMLPAYREFVDTFFAIQGVTFKCIVLDTRIIDYDAFHKGDKELGFYKFYFQLISRNMQPGNLYWLYPDDRNNRKGSRLPALKIITNRWCAKRMGVEPLRNVEAKKSHDEDLLQLADVLVGACAYAWNERSESEAKLDLQYHIEKRLGRSLRTPTDKIYRSNMSVWLWRPNGA